MALDASGLTPRPEVARALSGPVREALVEARADGWCCGTLTTADTASAIRPATRT